jgi:hypothetical protein
MGAECMKNMVKTGSLQNVKGSIASEYMKNTEKNIGASSRKRITEQWLDDRWGILEMTNSPADKAYYEGALKAVQFLGFDWKREDGKHKIF